MLEEKDKSLGTYKMLTKVSRCQEQCDLDILQDFKFSHLRIVFKGLPLNNNLVIIPIIDCILHRDICGLLIYVKGL